MANRAAYSFCQFLLRVAGTLVWRVHAEGRDRIPKTGAVIVASTHESFLDPLVVGAYIPRHGWHMARRTLFVNKAGKRSRFWTWFAAIFGVIEVDRDGTGLGALRGAEEKLAEGGLVLIFPEGTRSTDGEIQEFRAGVGLLARRSGATVVPVSVAGTRKIWGKGRKVPKFGKGPVRLVYGEPICYAEGVDGAEPLGAKEIAVDLRERILALRGSDSKPTAPLRETSKSDAEPTTNNDS